MLIIIILNVFVYILNEPIFVFEHFRHGSRTPGIGSNKEKPIGEYKDMYGVNWKSNGQLTGLGLRMEYTLGVRNRYRYRKLISTLFDPKEVLVVSSVSNWALASAHAQMEGMFPPLTGFELKDKELNISVPPNPMTEAIRKEMILLGKNALPEKIQIVPIHIFNEKEIEHILTKPSSCPPLEKIKEDLRNSNVFKAFFNKLNKTYGKELMTFFNENNTDFLFNYSRVFDMAEVFLTNYYNDRNISHLERAGINLEVFKNLSYEMKNLYLFTSECNEQNGVLGASPSIRKILRWMERRMDRDMKGGGIPTNYQEPKFVIYSGHDMTMSPFELFFKSLFNTKLKFPEFGSNMFLELHRKNDLGREPKKEDYYVEYYFDDELLLNISFLDFKTIIKEKAWSDERILQYCQPPLKGRIILIAVAGVIVICFALFLTASLLCFNTSKKSKDKRYHSIDHKEKYLI